MAIKIGRKFIVDFVDKGVANDYSKWKIYKSSPSYVKNKSGVISYIPNEPSTNCEIRLVVEAPNCTLADIDLQLSDEKGRLEFDKSMTSITLRKGYPLNTGKYHCEMTTIFHIGKRDILIN